MTRIELLHVDGCPGHERLLPALARLAENVDGELAVRIVETPEQAAAERFLGSPTVRVDGEDVEPGAGARTGFGLSCRLYRVDGRWSPAPPEEWVRTALALRTRSRRARPAIACGSRTDDATGRCAPSTPSASPISRVGPA